MAIKPVDLQMMIPRTMDAAKMRSDEMQKNAALTQQQAAAAQNKADDTVRQVYSRSKTEDVQINEKQKENNHKEENKKKKKDADEKSEEKSGSKYRKTIRTSTIDIKI